MFFFDLVPQLGHFGVESSEKDCTFSKLSPHWLQRYWYVGIRSSVLSVEQNSLESIGPQMMNNNLDARVPIESGPNMALCLKR